MDWLLERVRLNQKMKFQQFLVWQQRRASTQQKQFQIPYVYNGLWVHNNPFKTFDCFLVLSSENVKGL